MPRNAQTPDEKLDVLNGAAKGRLRSFIDRLERLGEDKQAISDDEKEVMKEMKGEGYDTKTVRKILRVRKMGMAKYSEEQALFDLYIDSLDMGGL